MVERHRDEKMLHCCKVSIHVHTSVLKDPVCEIQCTQKYRSAVQTLQNDVMSQLQGGSALCVDINAITVKYKHRCNAGCQDANRAEWVRPRQLKAAQYPHQVISYTHCMLAVLLMFKPTIKLHNPAISQASACGRLQSHCLYNLGDRSFFL